MSQDWVVLRVWKNRQGHTFRSGGELPVPCTIEGRPTRRLAGSFAAQGTDATDTRRSKKVFNPDHGLAATNAQGEEGPLLSASESHEERIQLLHAIGCETPPRLVVEPIEDHGVELEALALMNRHERNLTKTLELVQGIRPSGCMLETFPEKQHKPIPDAIEVRLALIRRKCAAQDLYPNEVEGRLCGLGCRIRYGLKDQ
jgi:hypothetical protein